MKLNWMEVKEVLSEQISYANSISEVMEKLLQEENEAISIECKDGALEATDRVGRFFYNKGRILQALKGTGNQIDFYDANGFLIESTTPSKALEHKKYEPKTDLVTKFNSLFTGEAMYTSKENIGYHSERHISEGLNPKTFDVSKDCYNDYLFVENSENHLINNYKVLNERTRFRRWSYYAPLEFKTNVVEKYIPNYFEKLDEESIQTRIYDKGVFFENGSFFYNVCRYSGMVYKIPTYQHEELVYTVIDDMLYYINDKKKVSSENINSEYSTEVFGYYVRFSDGKILFEKQPYAKYPRIYEIDNSDYIVFGNNLFKIDVSEFEFVNGVLVNNNSNAEITSSQYSLDVVIPYKNVFFIVRENKVYVYDREVFGSSLAYVYETGLSNYKQLRFSRRKSYFWVNDEYLISNCNEFRRYIKLSSVKEKTMKCIAEDVIYFEDIEGCKWLFSSNGLKIKLQLNLKKDLVESWCDNGTIVCVLTKGDTKHIQINNVVLELRAGKLYNNSNLIAEKVVLEERQLNFKPLNDVFEYGKVMYISDMSARYEGEFARSTWIDEENDSILVLCSRVNKYNYIVISKKDNIISEIDYSLCEYFNVDSSYKAICISSMNKKTMKEDIKGYIIDGWFINEGYLVRIGKNKKKIVDDIYSAIKDLKLPNDIKKDAFLDELLGITVNVLFDYVSEHGIVLDKDVIYNNLHDRDFIDVITNLDNIEKHLEKEEYSALIDAINGYYSETDFSSEYLDNINTVNLDAFMRYGISIDKFNNYNGNTVFTAHSSGVYAIKSSIEENVFTQIEAIIGSRMHNKVGILQIKKLENLCDIEEKILGTENSDRRPYMTLKSKDRSILNSVNKLGYRVFKMMKSFKVTLDYVNREIIISGKRFSDCSFSKIITFLNQFVSVLDKIIFESKKICDSKVSDCVRDMVIWCKEHVESTLAGIDVNLKDSKSPKLEISLWDRNNIVRSLTQGSRTQCCVAINSYNIGALVRYIFNKNIVLAEITDKGNVIGQAYIYVGVTVDKVEYRYENKNHIFMVIDNVEIAEQYTQYSKDIAKNLQRFMYEYSKYVSVDKISDVLLGVNYNDIRPPFRFSMNLNIAVLGNRLYRDSTSEFYKFL